MKNKPISSIDVKEAAKRIGCTRQYVMQLIGDGRLQAWKANGKCWCLIAASVERFMKKRTAKKVGKRKVNH